MVFNDEGFAGSAGASVVAFTVEWLVCADGGVFCVDAMVLGDGPEAREAHVNLEMLLM
jgi:hypothetical protein